MAEYRDLSVVGTGGCAEVRACDRKSDGKRFAKKFLTRTSEKMIRRFQQEVRILEKLDHPRIVKVIDTQLTTEPYWYVMPYYADPLKDLLPSIIGNADRVQKVFTAILDGMEYAHREGVIHRDLKSSNVMMNSDDDVVITDFGIGRVLDSEEDRVTATGAAIGSRSYGSPEQFTDAKHVDERSDIYCLGRLLYEMHTEPLNSSVQSLDRVPAHIAPIVAKCTQHKPEDRYQSVTELKQAWRAATSATSTGQPAGEAKRLVGELSSTPTGRGNAEALLKLIAANEKNADILRDSLMELPPPTAAIMASIDGPAFQKMVHSFVDHITSQTWGATYLDRVGLQCGQMAIAVPDATVRAELMACLVLIGVEGKRYAALETLAQLLQSHRDQLEIRTICDRLTKIPAKIRQEAGRRLELDELDKALAAVFRA